MISRIFGTLSRRGLSKWGQPHKDTHPHIISQREHVNNGISVMEFAERRSKLIQVLNENGFEKGLLVITGACTSYMTDKIPYFFRQKTDFRYFSGCLEPSSSLTIDIANSNSTLFLRDPDPRRELWEGPSTSIEDAVSYFGVSDALPMSQFTEHLMQFRKANDGRLLFDPSGPEWSVHEIIKDLHNQKPFNSVVNPTPYIHAIRCIKSKAEIDLMLNSAIISSHAFKRTMQATSSLETESDVFATMDYHVRMYNGANFLAYPPVVASGANANIIHYISNNAALHNGEMILMDAGGEYHGYSSDISRTWPINGKFSLPQRVLYEMIYEVQTSIFHKLLEDPSKQTIDSLYSIMISELNRVIKSAGILRDGVNSSSLVHQLCPHHVSHYLGMDIHDTPLASKKNSLKPGMVITVEPGIYISSSKFSQYVKKEFLDIGVRIEDDLLITHNGIDVLTKDCPKTIQEIEEVMGSEEKVNYDTNL
ncbi:xaa-Pro aminopeptidase 3 [Lepeophtheirus salmonis]|uniref:xaa-Pro aminopeptidase 3 n=1 Tax=Lepeophtheirus salmonis TaxID=72036 RepID=UPI001AE8F3E8|nr:xaa-Pro aminopeptidase 3-like [Lepeophtheirus salmonis]